MVRHDPRPAPDAGPQTNFADELTDWGVPPQAGLKREVGTPTPVMLPGGKIVTTVTLAKALAKNEFPILLIDAWDDPRHQSLPGAQRLPFAGHFGEYRDEVQFNLGRALLDLTRGDRDMPIVFFCAGARCWESYNAALRAIRLGFSNVYWYRGGVAAWEAAGLPFARTASR